jgi:hypothetical protein
MPLPTTTAKLPLDIAPGNEVVLNGTGLDQVNSIQFGGQGAFQDQLMSVAILSSTPTTLHFIVPDGVRDGTLELNSPSGALTVNVRVTSQYVQANEYQGEGGDTSTLTMSPTDTMPTTGGELDIILRRASAYADSAMQNANRGGVRIMQWPEQHSWGFNTRRLLNTQRIYPWRRPIISLDKFDVQVSNTQWATFPTDQLVINHDLQYVEVLSYAVASYVLLGAYTTWGLMANIARITYTAGYASTSYSIAGPSGIGLIPSVPVLAYPGPLREATKMIATELLIYRNLNAQGMAAFQSVKQGNQAFQRRTEGFEIPDPALELLMPYRYRYIA